MVFLTANLKNIQMLEELVVFGRASADPWNRISCCCKDAVFLLIEFCQLQGPKPLAWFPKNTGPHLDLDQVAIWIMSSDNVHGSFSNIYNQQLGLYMLVQHSTMFDITARAFQRPFALAMLTPHAPSASTTLQFQNKCIEVIRPLLSCNRTYFHWLVRHCVHIVEDNEANHFDNYYALSKEEPGLLVLSSRLKAMAQQARPWHTRFLENQVLAGNRCECGSDFSEFNKFAPLIDQYTSVELLPLFELAPCAGQTFLKSMEEAYHLFSVTDEPAKGILFSYNTPLIRSFFGANSQLQDQRKEDEHGNRLVETENHFPCENSLKSLSSSLVHCLFPLLAGERIAILAAKQRECTGLDLIRGLDSLRICKRNESSALWTYDGETSDLSSNHQLYGYSCKKATAVNWKNENFSAVIDLNHHKLFGKEYSGKLLPILTSLKNFPSDNSLKQWIVSIITDLHQLVLLAKYTSVQLAANELHLSVADQLMVMNGLVEMNIAKYTLVKQESRKLSRNLVMKNIRL